MTIVPFLKDNVFGPTDIQAMSVALDDVCKILNVADEAGRERELLAKNIIAFAHQGQRDAPLLRSHAEGDHLWSRRVACGARPRRASRGRCEIPSNLTLPWLLRRLSCLLTKATQSPTQKSNNPNPRSEWVRWSLTWSWARTRSRRRARSRLPG